MCDCGIAAGEGFSAAAFEVSHFDCGRSEIGPGFFQVSEIFVSTSGLKIVTVERLAARPPPVSVGNTEKREVVHK
jgi:hypothetical protein